MKNKKLLAAIVAVTMSATAAASFTACKTDKHTHTYTDWTVTTPATCTTEGVETGTCKDDGATDTRTIPALGHKYGDWNVTKEPTLTEKGSATKACANDSAKDHPITIDLPALTDSAYKVDVIKDTPTYKDSKYTYSPAQGGSIVITAHEDKKNVTLTVSQAVETANDARYIALVGKGEGSYYNKMYQEYLHRTVEETKDLLYEYGDNYTHIKDDAVNEMEYWADKDAEGNVSGVMYKDGKHSWIDEVTADYYNGMYFNAPAGILEDSYQYIEGLLDALYEAATAPVYYNNEFTESVENSTYKFSWTILTQTNNFKMNDDESDYEELNIHTTIKHISVEFSLDASYMLNSFKLNAEQYLTEKYTYFEADKATKPLAFTYDSQLEVFIPNADAENLPFDYDAEKKTYSPKDGLEPETLNEITVTQTALKDIEKLPVNEFKHDDISVSSFKLMPGKEVTEEEWNAADENEYVKKIEESYSYEVWDWVTAYMLYSNVDSGATLSGDTSSGVKLAIDGIKPESALEYMSLNPARAYLVENGKETLIYSSDEAEQAEKVPEEYTNWMTQDDYLQVNCVIEYDYDFDKEVNVFESAYFTLRSKQKVGDFNVKFTFGEAEFNITYHVDVAKPANISTDVSVYNEVANDYIVNSTDTATAYVGQSLDFVAKADAGIDSYLVDGRVSVTLDGGTENATLTATENGYKFVATAAGEYVINVVSLADETITSTLTVTVEAAPDVEAMLTGDYSAGDFSVSFNDNQVTVTDGAEVNETFGYTYADGTLTAVSNDGKYSIVLTENYKLALAIVDEFGDDDWAVLKVKVVESEEIKAVKAALADTWTGVYELDDGGRYTMTLVINSDGTATFTDSMYPAETVDYTLTDNGDGNYGITFNVGTTFMGFFFPLLENGSSFSYNGSAVSNFSMYVDDMGTPVEVSLTRQA